MLQQYIIEVPDYGYLDTYGDVDASFTYNFEDLEELSSKTSKYSKTIKLPGTNNNNDFFKYFYELGITNSFNANKRVRCNVRIGDNNIFSGFLKLEKVINDFNNIEYEVNILSIEKNLFELIGDEILPNLNLSRYNHIRNKETIQASWDNYIYENSVTSSFELGKGYVYPRIIYGNATDIIDKWYTFDAFPAIYVKTIIDSMFENWGYKYKSDFFNTEYFKRLIIPYNKSKIELTEDSETQRELSVGIQSGDSPYNLGLIKNDLGEDYESTLNIVLNDSSSLDFSDDLNQWQTTKYVCEKQGIYNIDFTGKLVFKYESENGNDFKFDTGTGMEYTYDMFVVRQGGGWQMIADSGRTLDNPWGVLQTAPSDNAFHTSPWYDQVGAPIFSLNASNIYLEPGDQIIIRFQSRQASNNDWDVQGLGSNNVSAYPYLYRSLNQELTSFNVTVAENILMDNEEIDFYQILPNIKIVDFFKSIVNLFNLAIVNDPTDDTTLIIEPQENYLKSKKTILDWSNLLDRDDEIEIIPTSNITAQKYNFSYKLDSDYFNEDYNNSTYRTYGDLEINTDNDFNIRTEKTELIFASTPSAKFLGLENTILPWFVEVDDESNITPKSVIPRILFYGGLIDGDTINLVDNTNDTSPIVLTQYPYCGHWDNPTTPRWDLNFGTPTKMYWNPDVYPTQTVFNQFHKNYLESIISPDGRRLKGNFYLTPDIISQIDPRDIIQIDNVNWRILSINDYNPIAYDKTTEVELLKIIDFEKYQETYLSTPKAYSSCPSDMVVTKKGEYVSLSGQPITQTCCESIGGKWSGGVCIIQPKNGKDPYGDITPVKGDGGIKVNDGNTTKTNTVIEGKNNIITNKSKNITIMGDNNGVSNQTPAMIIGNNNTIEGNNSYIFGNFNKIPAGVSSSFVFSNSSSFLDQPSQSLSNVVIMGVDNVYVTSSNVAYLPGNLNLVGPNPTINNISINSLVSSSQGWPGVLSIDNTSGGTNVVITTGDVITSDIAVTNEINMNYGFSNGLLISNDSGSFTKGSLLLESGFFGDIVSLNSLNGTILTDASSSTLNRAGDTIVNLGNFNGQYALSSVYIGINESIITQPSEYTDSDINITLKSLPVTTTNTAKNTTLISTQNSTRATGISNSSIIAGNNNTLNSSNSSILAGEYNTIENNITGRSVIIGGDDNNIKLDSDNSVILGSESSIISGSSFSTIIGGNNNTINNASNSAIIAAENVIATEDRTLYNQDNYHDAFHTVTTTNNTITTLYQFTPSNGVYHIEWDITGFESATDDALIAKAFHGFKVIGGVVTSVSTTTLDRKSNFPAAVTVTIDTDGTLIRARVTGRTGSTIVWRGHLKITK